LHFFDSACFLSLVVDLTVVVFCSSRE